MMEVQEALNYLVLEYQTNHDFRWGLFTVGGVILNAVLMLCVGRFGKSKPIAVEVLKSYEKGKSTEHLGLQETDRLLREVQPKSDLATGVPPAPTPIEAPKDFSQVVQLLLSLPPHLFGEEWTRQLQDSKDQMVDEYLAYHSGNVLIGYTKMVSYGSPYRFDLTHICLVDPKDGTVITRTRSDFTQPEWTALEEKFDPIRKKVEENDKKRVEQKEIQILRSTQVNPLIFYKKDELLAEIVRRDH